MKHINHLTLPWSLLIKAHNHRQLCLLSLFLSGVTDIMNFYHFKDTNELLVVSLYRSIFASLEYQ